MSMGGSSGGADTSISFEQENGGLRTFSYWVGVRVPTPGAGLQLHLDTTDPLGFAMVQTSQLLDFSAAGSIQGTFVYWGDLTSQRTVYIDYLGLPGGTYDWAVQD